jgi:hypothetical protein
LKRCATMPRKYCTGGVESPRHEPTAVRSAKNRRPAYSESQVAIGAAVAGGAVRVCG